MAALEDLLNDLANLDAQHDLDGIRAVREKIVAEHGETDAAVEAQYKLGLDFLFRQRDMIAAMEAFSAAAKRKHPYWSAAARTSLGLCYYHQRRLQKALFELRKVAHPDQPSAQSVTALSFLENIFVDEGKLEEVERVRKERMGQLETLLDPEDGDPPQGADRGYFLLLLGTARRDAGDEEGGRKALEEARDLGAQVLGEDLHRSVLDALS